MSSKKAVARPAAAAAPSHPWWLLKAAARPSAHASGVSNTLAFTSLSEAHGNWSNSPQRKFAAVPG